MNNGIIVGIVYLLCMSVVLTGIIIACISIHEGFYERRFKKDLDAVKKAWASADCKDDELSIETIKRMNSRLQEMAEEMESR